MNVVRPENNLAPTRGRGRPRGRGRDARFVTNNPIINLAPKYDFEVERHPLVNNDLVTPRAAQTPSRNPRRGQVTRSSSVFINSHRRNQSSSGQTSPRSFTSASESCVILAITSGRGDARGEVGMAAIDVQYPHMILYQISDFHTYANTLSKINSLRPVEILMPNTMCERSVSPNDLYRVIKAKFEGINITEIARMHFHDSEGLDRIKTHCAEEFAAVELLVKQKYYALAAAAALLKYVEYIQHVVYSPKSMKIEYEGSQNTAMIDIESVQSMGLVTSQSGRGKSSLLGSLDRCSTPMGRRLLRASILQPSSDADLIKNRQACVEELVTNKALHSIMQPVIKRLFGASRLLSIAILTCQDDNVRAAEQNLNYILLLKHIIDIIPEIRSVLATGQADFFKTVHENLKDRRYQLIKEKILSVVHAEARSLLGFTSANMQRCFAIRPGLNDLLDIARQAYCEFIDDMQDLVAKLSEEYKLPLALGCNATLGYHIEMEAPRRKNFKIEDLPKEFIEAHKQKNKILMTTEYLIILSQHCMAANAELHIMSNVLLNEALTGIREHIGCLLKLNDDVAELDLLLSLAQVSALPGYVKPTFGPRLELIESRHPVMDIWGVDRPIPNDVIASNSYNFHTITGPNMSGKSVYLKQIVLLQIMGQIGCYVPATKAEFRLTDRIFCRIPSADDIECNSSTFVLEIKEAQYILQSITPTSLVILDELCRSTTVEEGSSIAWAICEKLILTSDAFVFNATHFLYLTRLAEMYYNVTNHYFETEFNVLGNSSRLIYTHKLMTGIAPVWNYGIALARSTHLPESIVSLAQNFAKVEIAKTVNPSEWGNQTNSLKKLHYDCIVRIDRLLESDEFTVGNIVKLVNELKIPGMNSKGITLSQGDKVLTGNQTNVCSPAISSRQLKQGFVEKKPMSKRMSTSSTSSNHETIKKAKLDASMRTEMSDEAPSRKSTEIRVSQNFSNASYENSHSYIVDYNQLLISPTISVNETEMMTSTPNTTSNNESYCKSTSQECVDAIQEESYCSRAFSFHNNSTTTTSTDTALARKTAREKEAKIFRILEGSDFDESSFNKSFHSTISLGSSDED